MQQLLVRELVLRLNYSKRDLIKAAANRLGITPPEIRLLRLVRRSLDARPIRPHPCYVVNALFLTTRPVNPDKLKKVDPSEDTPSEFARIPAPAASPTPRPVVVGAGPAGLLAAYYLAMAGARPLLLERGRAIQQRRPAVGAFWGKGILDPENNALYGEGGAGAFSDGKLTARTKDLDGRDYVLNLLAECGAPEQIRYDAQAHLGSDKLALIIPALRARIEEAGGEVRFSARVEGLHQENGRLRGLLVNGEELECSCCILATGHSAGDVYRMLARQNVALESKGYAVGVRVKMAQERVNRSQWGRFAGLGGLGAASFFLTCGGRCHSFCMCPGGSVIACAQSPGLLGTNGMSLSARSGRFANAAFLIPQNPDPTGAAASVQPEGLPPVLAELLRLEDIERRAFAAGGSDYSLPATTLAAFPESCPELPAERSCRRARAADFRSFLPESVWRELAACLPQMLQKLGRPNPDEILLYGAETRSTSALRVVRNARRESVNLKGLFPAGEGAGYAGGIVSSAIDGLRAAQAALLMIK